MARQASDPEALPRRASNTERHPCASPRLRPGGRPGLRPQYPVDPGTSVPRVPNPEQSPGPCPQHAVDHSTHGLQRPRASNLERDVRARGPSTLATWASVASRPRVRTSPESFFVDMPPTWGAPSALSANPGASGGSAISRLRPGTVPESASRDTLLTWELDDIDPNSRHRLGGLFTSTRASAANSETRPCRPRLASPR